MEDLSSCSATRLGFFPCVGQVEQTLSEEARQAIEKLNDTRLFMAGFSRTHFSQAFGATSTSRSMTKSPRDVSSNTLIMRHALERGATLGDEQ